MSDGPRQRLGQFRLPQFRRHPADRHDIRRSEAGKTLGPGVKYPTAFPAKEKGGQRAFLDVGVRSADRLDQVALENDLVHGDPLSVCALTVSRARCGALEDQHVGFLAISTEVVYHVVSDHCMHYG